MTQSRWAALRTARWLVPLFLGVAALLAWPRLSSPSFGAAGDLAFHYHFTRAFQQSLAEGDWLPQWAGLLDGGRGEALFTFYPPLCFWLTAKLAQLGQTDLLNGLKLTTFLCLLFAQGSAYALARAFFNQRTSALAAVLFALLPAYPLITLNRALLPNALALCFVPLVLLAAQRLLAQENVAAALLLFAFSVSAIVSTHVVTTYLCALAVALLTLSHLPTAGWRGIRNLALGSGAAFLLTAFLLVPQKLEIDWVNVKVLTEQHDFRSYFLFAPPRSASAYHQAWASLNEAASWITVLQTALVALLGLLLWRKPLPAAQKLLVRFCLACAGFGLLISLPVSTWLWEHLPGLSYLQFPWRFQALVGLSGGLLLACLWSYAQTLPQQQRRALLLWPVLLLLGNGLFTYATARHPKAELSHAQMLTLLNASDLPPTTTEGLREWQTKEDFKYLPLFANQISYRPRGSEVLLYAAAQQYGGLEFISGRGQILEQQLFNQQRRFRLSNAEPVRVRLKTYAYPNWSARLDGAAIPIEREPDTGLMTLALPSGEHTLEFSYATQQPVIRWARRVSAVAWLLFGAALGGLAYTRWRASQEKRLPAAAS